MAEDVKKDSNTADSTLKPVEDATAPPAPRQGTFATTSVLQKRRSSAMATRTRSESSEPKKVKFQPATTPAKDTADWEKVRKRVELGGTCGNIFGYSKANNRAREI